MIGAANPLVVRHFGLHAIGYLLEWRWASVGPETRDQLKSWLLHYVEQGTLPFEQEQGMIKEKASVLVAQLAVREWPQRWPGLTDELSRIANQGHLQVRAHRF